MQRPCAEKIAVQLRKYKETRVAGLQCEGEGEGLSEAER